MTALLLAEPEATMRGFLERQLRSDGFDVLAFPSTDELPRSADPDVFVLGDPDELDRCLVPDCPVIVLGGTDPQARVRALERCDDYLVRPFAYEELADDIKRFVRERLSAYAYPRRIEFVADLPKTLTGKIRRIELLGELSFQGARGCDLRRCRDPRAARLRQVASSISETTAIGSS